MNCFFHPHLSAVAECAACKKNICKSCATEYAGGLYCPSCINSEIDYYKNEIATRKRFFKIAPIIGAVVGIALLIFSGDFSGIGDIFIALISGMLTVIMIAGIPIGMKALQKLTETMTILAPISEWIIWFGIKVIISFFIGGLVIAPITIFTYKKQVDYLTEVLSSKNLDYIE